jgi:hypothetical protein
MVGAGMTADEFERDEADERPEVDPINTAICPLIAAVFELTAPGSLERKAALSEVLEAAERVKRALVPSPRLQ